jgi:3-dehydroquinate dehydratase-1
MKSSFLSVQKKRLSIRPLVVGTLVNHGKIQEQLAAAGRSGIDLLELRLDTFPQAQGPFQKTYEFGRGLIRDIKEKLHLPILLTLRAHDERGPRPAPETLSDAHRAEILARLLPSVDMVDVELRHAPFAKRMTVVAHIHGVDVIHSAHHFTGVWTAAQLARLCAASQKLGGDIFKAAVMPSSNAELAAFLAQGRKLPSHNKVLIGMGRLGEPSRLFGFSFGSILTYGHLGRSAAAGQIPARALVDAVKELYGRG